MKNLLLSLGMLLFLLTTSCAHQALTPDGQPLPDEKLMTSGDEDGPDEANQPTHGPEDEAPLKVGRATAQNDDLSDSEMDAMHLPEDFNQNVNMWIEYFQGRGRGHMERYLGRSTRFIPKMKEILKKHGLPEDLVYLALIESGFNSQAFSHARAVGFWQFIRGTARRYDLKIDYYTDERSDYIQSTEAAAQYLKALYNLFGSWYLAIASYNVGENKVKNLVMKYYTRDFWELARKRKLPRETVHYVPKFLAARMIAKHPEKYGFTNVQYQAPLDFQEIKFNKSISLINLSQQLGMTYEDLHALNPAFKKGIVPYYNQDITLRVPSSLNKEQVLAAMENSSAAVVVAQAVNQTEENEFVRYKIRSGDTLSSISRKFRISMGTLIDINDLSRRTVLRVGRTLRVPKNERAVSSKKPTTKIVVKPSKIYTKNFKFDVKRKAVAQKVHVVRSGETLLNIANRYNVRMSHLITHNRLRQSEKILIGSRIKIPR